MSLETSPTSAEQTRSQIASLTKPSVQLILSGKRKCGKDYLEQLILERYPELVLSYRISAPIKGAFARAYCLDFTELLSASQYKENYREQMVTWSEQIRQTDPHYFLRLSIVQAAQETENAKPIWLLNDARRPTDLAYFTDSKEIDLSATKVIKLRLVSNEETRKERGWIFTEGIDDKTTECGLDSHQDWDYVIQNDGTKEELLKEMEPIFALVEQCFKSN